ncbi:MAG: hypothetical protein Q8S13_05545 [Dehalococcoidia bacterium]|nr:hypothetical protein [Dehalococcoidia bacterium]
MPRYRSVRPDFHQDRRVGRLTREVRGFALGLMGWADDDGRFEVNLRFLRTQIVPYDDDVDDETIAAWLEDLQREKLLVLYEVEGRRYGAIDFRAKGSPFQQRIDKPTPSELPAPEPAQPDLFAVIPGGLATSRDRSGCSVEERRGEERGSGAAAPEALAVQVQELGRYWIETCQLDPARTRIKPGTPRWRKMAKEVAERGLEVCKQAVLGMSRTPWNMGLDPQTQGKRYLDIDLCLRDDKHVERFLEAALGARRVERACPLCSKPMLPDQTTVRGARGVAHLGCYQAQAVRA